MSRHVAFLRGVSPMNLRMPDLQRALEAAGFTNVRTLLSSGNVAFDTRAGKLDAIARRVEQAMTDTLGRSFGVFVRTSAHLQALVDAQPFSAFDLPPGAKPVITFLRRPPPANLALPIEGEGAAVVASEGHEVLSYYVPGTKGPVFMNVLERTFGKDITTRTLDTVRRSAAA